MCTAARPTLRELAADLGVERLDEEIAQFHEYMRTLRMARDREEFPGVTLRRGRNQLATKVNSQSKLIRISDAGAEQWDNPYAGPGKPESAFRSLARLLDAVDTGQPPSNSGQDNLKTIALLEAAYASAEQNRPVELTGGLPR